MKSPLSPGGARAVLSSLFLILLFTDCATPQTGPQQTQTPARAASSAQATQPAHGATPATPSDTLREFARAMRERRFRDAFALTVLSPAVESMTAEEFEEMRPEIEKLVPAMREQVEIGGEQMSGDAATVFARLSNEPGAPFDSVPLTRAGAGWLIGERADYEQIRREGKEFLFKARVETHQAEVQKVLVKIANAEAAYAAQNGGAYADLSTLAQNEMSVRIGLREDLDALQTLGYRVSFAPGRAEQGYRINAEPMHYGRTGRLSFYMDKTGIQSKDTGGKPFNAQPIRKK